MIKDNISIDEAIDFLNELKDIDNEFLCRLINQRVLCNNDLLNHPTVQCSACEDDMVGEGFVGFLGVLNGLFGIDDETGWGVINVMGEFDENEKSFPEKFTKIIKIQKTDFDKVKNQQAQYPIQARD